MTMGMQMEEEKKLGKAWQERRSTLSHECMHLHVSLCAYWLSCWQARIVAGRCVPKANCRPGTRSQAAHCPHLAVLLYRGDHHAPCHGNAPYHGHMPK